MKNYYEILEVNKKASMEVIEKAYKVLVKKYHPDLNNGPRQKEAEYKIKEINEAYHILSSQFLREQYDIELEKEEMQKYVNRNQYNGQIKTQQAEQRKTKREATQQENVEIPQYKVGSFSSLVELTKLLFKRRKNREKKKMTREDGLAIGLTIIIVIIIGIILWFIPFTNGWMRELLLENPLIDWIWK